MAFNLDEIEKKVQVQKTSNQNQRKDISDQEKDILKSAEIYRKGLVTIKDLIAPSAMRVSPAYLELGEQVIRTIFVTTFPRYVNVGWLSPVLNFSDTNIDISMYFYPVKAEKILKQLKKRVGTLQAEMSADREKGLPRDPVKETALHDIEDLRNNLTMGTEHFFQFSLYVTIYGDNKEELDNYTEKLENMFSSKLVYTRRALYQSEQGFNATLPLSSDQIGVSVNMNSSSCAASFPFMSADLTSNNGILYGVNRHNNSLILFDRFSMPNANFVVFATSGAGKSYFTKLEILRSLMMGTDIIVIDPEKEYKYLSDAVGGTYVNISLSSKAKLNPFDLPRSVKGMQSGDIIRSAVISVKGLLKLMIGSPTQDGKKGFTASEDSILDRALLETYAKKDIVPGADLEKAEVPILSDLQEILQGMEGGANLAQRLAKYTEGTFEGFLNHPTNVAMENQLVTFSVRDLEDELRPLAIYTIVNYIWNVVRSEMKKRLLFVDEAWWLMQNEDSAKFIFALVKRCRKYYLGVTTITQDVNDFLRSPYGKAIVTNSSLKMLLRQSSAAIDNIVDTFMLTESEKYLLLESGIGEGVFFAGTKRAAIKVVASYSEDQIITSDPEEILKIEKSKKEFANKKKNNK